MLGDVGNIWHFSFYSAERFSLRCAHPHPIAKEYRVGIAVGEKLRERVVDVPFRERDQVRVKGKEEPVAIYEPLGLTKGLSAANSRS